MNEDQIQQQPQNQVPNLDIGTNPETPKASNPIWDKLPQSVKDLATNISQSKIYANKKIFWLITGVLSILTLTIIVGLIFGDTGKNTQTPKSLPSPTPGTMSEPTPQAKDALSETDDRLRDIKNRINNLDVKVSKLSPPDVNFKVAF